MHTRWVGESKGFVVGVEAAVESSACVQEGGDGGSGRGGHWPKGKLNGGKDVGDGHRDGSRGGRGDAGEAPGKEDQLVNGAFAVVCLRGKLDVGGGWRWVDDAAVGIAFDRLTIVVEAAFVGVVGKELAEEVGFGGGIIAQGTRFSGAGGSARVGFVTAEATTEGAREFAAVLNVREGVDGVVILWVASILL